MSDQPKPETITRPPAAGTNSNPETEAEQMKRMRGIFDELNEWLKERDVQIIPGWAPFLPVGTDGITFQISSRWSLTPLPQEQEK